MKRFCVCVVTVALLLSLAACGVETPSPEETDPSSSETTDATQPPEATDALSELRENMKPPVMAVADFGFPNLSDDFEIMDYLLDEFPKWMEEHDFIGEIPEERIVITCGYDTWANLLCIVPKDPQSTVCVEVKQTMDAEPYTKSDVVYRSESGEPILLLANITEDTSVLVTVTDSEGKGISWVPYWETYSTIPEDDYYGSQVMYFSPESEKTVYERYLAGGWVLPGEDFLTYHYLCSDSGYDLELYYSPEDNFDGFAHIYENDGYGEVNLTYSGKWKITDGNLQLDMVHEENSSRVIQGTFPVLTDSYGAGFLSIFRTEEGAGLPQFFDDMEYDELAPSGDALYSYEYALYQGWQPPAFEELINSSWISSYNYVLDLTDDLVPGDYAGEAFIYELSEDREYIKSHAGSWQYEDGMIHLFLVPENDNGVFVNDSYPVLTMNEELWIGRSENGLVLPHFPLDLDRDVLVKSKG